MRENGSRLLQSIDDAIGMKLWDVVVGVQGTSSGRDAEVRAFVEFNRLLWAASKFENNDRGWASFKIEQGLRKLLTSCEKFERRKGGDRGFANVLGEAHHLAAELMPQGYTLDSAA